MSISMAFYRLPHYSIFCNAEDCNSHYLYCNIDVYFFSVIYIATPELFVFHFWHHCHMIFDADSQTIFWSFLSCRLPMLEFVLRMCRTLKNILVAQQRQKEQYDCKHSNPEVFAVGALVLKKDFTRKKRAGGRLDSKWTGPYRIVKSLGLKRGL